MDPEYLGTDAWLLREPEPEPEEDDAPEWWTPKRCLCGAVYEWAEWCALQPPDGGQYLRAEDGRAELELRNCACGSTLAVELP